MKLNRLIKEIIKGSCYKINRNGIYKRCFINSQTTYFDKLIVITYKWSYIHVLDSE